MTELATDRIDIDRRLATVQELALSEILSRLDVHLEAISADGHRWIVHLVGEGIVNLKDSPESTTRYNFAGRGRSADQACSDLCQQLSGKLLVVQSESEGRIDIQMPQRVTWV